MKVVLYKFLEINDNAVESEFSRTEILNEEELREKFYWYLQNNYFDDNILKRYDISKNIKKVDVLDKTDISAIFSIFAENGDYNKQKFRIKQYEKREKMIITRNDRSFDYGNRTKAKIIVLIDADTNKTVGYIVHQYKTKNNIISTRVFNADEYTKAYDYAQNILYTCKY